MGDYPADLGELEHEVMQIVWASEAVTAEQVRELLPRPLKESTIRTVLKRLEDKGFVTHSVRGRTYIFAATQARRHVAAQAVQRIVDWLCNGSVEEVLVGMVDSAMLDSAKLEQLAKKVANKKQRRK